MNCLQQCGWKKKDDLRKTKLPKSRSACEEGGAVYLVRLEGYCHCLLRVTSTKSYVDFTQVVCLAILSKNVMGKTKPATVSHSKSMSVSEEGCVSGGIVGRALCIAQNRTFNSDNTVPNSAD